MQVTPKEGSSIKMEKMEIIFDCGNNKKRYDSLVTFLGQTNSLDEITRAGIQGKCKSFW